MEEFERTERLQEQAATQLPFTSVVANSPVAALIPFDPIAWGRLNPWLVEGQADDRLPMDGTVAELEFLVPGNSAPAKRSLARRSHQLMFKKWSQARHF